jgi:hypothetical protein
LRKELSENAVKHVAATRTPEISAKQLVNLWQEVMAEPPKFHNFEAVLGKSPLDWFIASQGISAINVQDYQGTTKGTLAHFKRVFAGDESLIGL